jgi:hypothetical protein
MAEVYVFQTRSDFKVLCDFFVANYGVEFWLDRCYDSSTGNSFDKYEDIEQSVISSQGSDDLWFNSYHLTSKSWSIEPIYYSYIEPVDSKYRPYYSVIQKFGGPSIHIVPSSYGVGRLHADRIICGLIADYPYYISGSFLAETKVYRTMDRPQELTHAMMETKKFLSKHGKKAVYENGKYKRTAYVMQDALSEYYKGVKLVQGDMNFVVK